MRIFLLQHADASRFRRAHCLVCSRFPAGPEETRKCFRKP
ncbi:hypothetical protein X971_0307 [Agrobacterium tumefaciens LBA4213 (Ach5)]|nr:hypothetical protein X971_0307 [Agrobacterium tumefaciens LBA4213 (Ach5)]